MNYYCKKSILDDRCKFIVKDTNGVTSLVYTLLVNSFQVYRTNSTALTSTKLYSFYNTPVSLTIQNTSLVVTVKEFIEYYYYSIE